MTPKELSEIYGVPEKIVSPYFSEFLVNTIGTSEFETAKNWWNDKVTAIWEWHDGAQDQHPTVYATAFNPPSAYMTTQKNSDAWMLERITGTGDRAYYAISFSGNMDYRLGSFGVAFYPYVVQEVPYPYGLRILVWKIRVLAWISRNEFSGIPSLIAMSENGLGIMEYNLQRLKTALYYINAARKYAQELSVAKSLAKQKATADVENYQRGLQDNFRRETNDLEQKKLSMRVALSGQRAAAIGNMQNALINLQSLKF